MARSTEEIVQIQLGSQALLIASLTSEKENMQAKIVEQVTKITELEAKIKELENVSAE